MSRPDPSNVRLVACVGAGTIGGGWAAYFLARGMDVIATDPDPEGETKLRRFVDLAWPALERLGFAAGASPDRLRYAASVAEAVAEADFIQESAPDREDLKIGLFEEIGAAARTDVVIASSSSKFLPSRISSTCAQPGRCIVGHPFTPSYLMPLVEVVGGDQTDDAAMDWAMAFYAGAGKVPLRLKREIEGYIANRLQHAVFEEMHRLVEAGVCDYEDVDTAMRFGPGLRWAFAGPMTCMHMAGGQGGIKGFIDHFGWSGPEALEAVAVGEIESRYGTLTLDQMEAWRDGNLLGMLGTLDPDPKP